MIVRHETGRVGRGAAVSGNCERTSQARGGRIVDEGFQGVAIVAPRRAMTLKEQVLLTAITAGPILLCELAWIMGWC